MPQEKPLTYAGVKYREIKESIFNILGHEYIICGFNDRRALQIDHINGGGEKHRKKYGGSTPGYYRQILKDPSIKENYQILCANCNFIKLRENEEYKRNNWTYKMGADLEATPPVTISTQP